MSGGVEMRYCVLHGVRHFEEGMFACNGPCGQWSCVHPTLDPFQEWCDECYGATEAREARDERAGYRSQQTGPEAWDGGIVENH